MSKINLTVEQINELQPQDITTNELVRDKFIQIYEAMWTPTTGVPGVAAYERESRFFNRILGEKEDIRKNVHASQSSQRSSMWLYRGYHLNPAHAHSVICYLAL